MFGYLARTLPLVLRAIPKRDGRLVSRLQRRVRLTEVDINLHMNQAAYAQVAELGRTDWCLRAHALSTWRRQRVKPVVAEQTVVYRRALRPRQGYTLDTRGVGFDGRLVRVESHFIVGERVLAKATAKLIFIGADGVLSAEATREACEAFVTEPLSVCDWKLR